MFIKDYWEFAEAKQQLSNKVSGMCYSLMAYAELSSFRR